MAIGLSNVNRRKPQSAAQKPQAKATSQLSLVAAVPAVVRPFIQPLKRERLTSSGEINEVWLEWASMVPGLIGKAPRGRLLAALEFWMFIEAGLYDLAFEFSKSHANQK